MSDNDHNASDEDDVDNEQDAMIDDEEEHASDADGSDGDKDRGNDDLVDEHKHDESDDEDDANHPPEDSEIAAHQKQQRKANKDADHAHNQTRVKRVYKVTVHLAERDKKDNKEKKEKAKPVKRKAVKEVRSKLSVFRKKFKSDHGIKIHAGLVDACPTRINNQELAPGSVRIDKGWNVAFKSSPDASFHIQPYKYPRHEDMCSYDRIKESFNLNNNGAERMVDQSSRTWLKTNHMPVYAQLTSIVWADHMAVWNSRKFWAQIWSVILLRFLYAGFGWKTDWSQIYWCFATSKAIINDEIQPKPQGPVDEPDPTAIQIELSESDQKLAKIRSHTAALLNNNAVRNVWFFDEFFKNRCSKRSTLLIASWIEIQKLKFEKNSSLLNRIQAIKLQFCTPTP